MYIIITIFFLLFVAYFIFSLTHFFNIVFRGYAPFVSTNIGTIKKIISELQVKGRPIIYELGCGKARFLRMAEKKFSQAKLIGIEDLITIYFINKIRLRLIGSRINLLKADFFKINLQDADIIYCYLNNHTMQSLGIKFLKECKKGTQIVSRSFPIPQLTPIKIIKIKYKNLYFYVI
jgi:hypothetical protein